MTIQICAREGVRVYHGSFFLRRKEVAFVCKERTDGKLVLPEAVKIMKIKAA